MNLHHQNNEDFEEHIDRVFNEIDQVLKDIGE